MYTLLWAFLAAITLAIILAYAAVINFTFASVAASLDPMVPRLLISVLLVIFLKAVKELAVPVLTGHIKERKTKNMLGQLMSYAIYAAGLFVIGFIVWTDFSNLALSAGIIGAALAISLQQPIMSVVGWVVNAAYGFYGIGDRIQIGITSPIHGDVLEISLFRTVLWEYGGEWVTSEQASGRKVMVPNSRILIEPIINYTRDFPYLFDEITVLIPHREDWAKAKAALEAVGNAVMTDEAKEKMLKYKSAADKAEVSYRFLDKPEITTRIRENGIELRLGYQVLADRRKQAKTELTEIILQEFAEQGIEI